jgi:hypothetical protein
VEKEKGEKLIDKRQAERRRGGAKERRGESMAESVYVCAYLGIGRGEEVVQRLQGLVGQVRRNGRDKHLDSRGLLYVHVSA